MKTVKIHVLILLILSLAITGCKEVVVEDGGQVDTVEVAESVEFVSTEVTEIKESLSDEVSLLDDPSTTIENNVDKDNENDDETQQNNNDENGINKSSDDNAQNNQEIDTSAQEITETIKEVPKIYFNIIGPEEVGNILMIEVDFVREQTAFELLQKIATENNISLDYSGSAKSAYIKGINGIYEKDYGPLSGWMYSVNGEFPLKSAGSFIVNEEDVVQFMYTKDMGNDLN